VKHDDQKIILVSGKGGVGKTAVAAALALTEVHKGNRCLLAELGEKSFLRHIFPGSGSGTAQKATDGLDVVRWDSNQCLHEYFLHYLRIEKIVELIFSNRVMQSIINAAPAVRELALLGKITSGPRGVGPDLPYGALVVDGFASGHFKALTKAPSSLLKTVSVGPMAENCRTMIEVLKNKSQLSFVIVTVAEDLALNEAEELTEFLFAEFGQKATVVLNKMETSPLTAEEWREVNTNTPDWVRPLRDHLDAQLQAQNAALQRVQLWKTSRTVTLPHFRIPHWPDLLRHMATELEKP
jgi:anion-transporting  ArsA/GET3 family ATPase